MLLDSIIKDKTYILYIFKFRVNEYECKKSKWNMGELIKGNRIARNHLVRVSVVHIKRKCTAQSRKLVLIKSNWVFFFRRAAYVSLVFLLFHQCSPGFCFIFCTSWPSECGCWLEVGGVNEWVNRNSWRAMDMDTNAFNADAGSLCASLSCHRSRPRSRPRPRPGRWLPVGIVLDALWLARLIEMFAGAATAQQNGGEWEHVACQLCATSKHLNCWPVGILFLRLRLHNCNNAATPFRPNSQPVQIAAQQPLPPPVSPIVSVCDVWSVSLRTCSGHLD